ncbi:hypothetical protein [Parasphingorhabdus pacifica]
MSYPQNQGPGPHAPNGHGHPPERDWYYEDRRGEGAAGVANVVRVVTSVIVTIFVLHVLFVVFGANQGNEFVSIVYTLAKTLVLGLGDVFTPDDAVLGVVLNYGLAALLYLVVGQLIVKALKRP